MTWLRRLGKAWVQAALLGACLPALGQTPPLSLDQAEGMALQNRPSIKASMEKVMAARDKEREAGASPPFRLEFGYGTRPELGIGNDLLFAAPIDIFGKTHAQWSAAHAEYLSAKASLAHEALDLQLEVFTAYSEALSAEALLNSARNLLDLAKQSYAATQQRISTGDLPPNQLLRADLEMKKAQQTLDLRQNVWSSSRRTLASTIGVDEKSLSTLSSALPDVPESVKAEERPDIAAAKAAIDAARAERSVAATSTSPDFELQFAHDYFDSSGHFTARAQFVWNFFDFGAGRNRQSAANHTKKAATYSLKDLMTQAKTQIEVAKSDYVSARQEADSYLSLEADAKTLLEKEEKAYALGASSLLDVIDAVRSLRDVEESAADARSREIVSAAKYLAAGGVLLGDLPKESRN